MAVDMGSQPCYPFLFLSLATCWPASIPSTTLRISSSTLPHCSVYCCLSCPNFMGSVSLESTNTDKWVESSIGTEGRHWNKETMVFPCPYYLLYLGSLRYRTNLSKLQEGRSCNMGFLGPALIGSRFSESGKR